jgi:hypothetical protein
MSRKACFKCGQVKNLTEFYKHPHMSDGRLNKCKECTKQDVRRNYRVNIEHYQGYERNRAMLPHRVASRKRYQRTSVGRAAVRRAHAASRARYPEKIAANIMVSNAIRNGKLIRLSCEVCGVKAQAHHDDYTKPLEVRWLCVKHHRAVHRGEQS